MQRQLRKDIQKVLKTHHIEYDEKDSTDRLAAKLLKANINWNYVMSRLNLSDAFRDEFSR